MNRIKIIKIQLFILIMMCSKIYYNCGQSLTGKEHRTPAAAERPNNLSCFKCHTMIDDENCINLTANNTSFKHKCKDDKRICMVKHFAHTITTENGTSQYRLWSLERNCTKNCEPGCIVIGERTKLYACTSCCEQSFCNNGTAGTISVHGHRFVPIIRRVNSVFSYTFLGWLICKFNLFSGFDSSVL